jgi:hypothetical protein
MVVVTVTLGASLSGATPVLTVTPAGTCSPKVGQDLVYECTGLGSGDSTITATASVSGERGRWGGALNGGRIACVYVSAFVCVLVETGTAFCAVKTP